MEKTNTIKSREKSLVNIIVITAIFAVVVSILMLFNYLQLATNDPIESETLTALTEQLADQPNNEQLKEEIRAFDLMARKAYFTSQWQIETGGWLLLIGAIVLIISLRYYFSITSKIEEPDENSIPNQRNRVLSSNWLLGTGGTLIVLAIVASFLSVDQLKKYDVNPAAISNNSTEEESIELVDLRDAEPTDSTTILEKEQLQQETKPAEPQKDTVKEAAKPVQKEKPAEKKIAKTNYPSIADLKQEAPGFRGPFGQGIYYAKNTPVSWDVADGTNVLWKVKVPVKGFSSPVVWGDKLFVTGANDQERWLYCYNKNTGKLLWSHQADNIPGSPAKPPRTTEDTGLAAPSVTSNGMQVVAIYATGDIIAFDMDGKRLWAKNLGVPDNHYGHSSSLISWQNKVIVQYDTNKGGRLLALNIETGEIIWDTKRNSHISWASPILADVGDKIQVITSTEPSVAGYDVETGQELWKVDCMMGEVGPSPAFGNGLAVAGNEYATLAVIDPTKGEIVWEDSEYLPEVASPVVADGLLIIGTTYAVLACYDIHTGNKYWEAEFDDGFYSSPVVADGKIYAADMDGIIHILKLDRELTKLGDIPMGEKVMTTPAFTDGRMYVRGNENLYCIASPLPTGQAGNPSKGGE